jgi:hypothetical protein
LWIQSERRVRMNLGPSRILLVAPFLGFLLLGASVAFAGNSGCGGVISGDDTNGFVLHCNGTCPPGLQCDTMSVTTTSGTVWTCTCNDPRDPPGTPGVSSAECLTRLHKATIEGDEKWWFDCVEDDCQNTCLKSGSYIVDSEGYLVDAIDAGCDCP